MENAKVVRTLTLTPKENLAYQTFVEKIKSLRYLEIARNVQIIKRSMARVKNVLKLIAVLRGSSRQKKENASQWG